MPAVPPCALCKTPEKIRIYLESNKKPVLVFSVFVVLLIEWFSIAYQKFVPQTPNLVYDRYLFFWYPMLTQLALFILFFSLYLWKDRLHFCFRKSATTFYLSCYYLLGFLGVLFCFSASIYYTIISFTSLVLGTLIFIVSLFNKSE
jgi:hypothetical protein